MSRLLAALVTGALVLIGSEPSNAAAPTAIIVFAASSLTEAFRAIGKDFEMRQPDARVRFNFAGSQELAAQIHHGAPADVFAAADEQQMAIVKAERPALISRPFAFNELTIAVSLTSAVAVAGLADLSRPGLKLVVADPAVPAGRYTAAMLQRAATLKGYGPSFPAKVTANVVSRETNVRQVATKVALGEADAGIVYVSDALGSLAGKLRTVSLPPAANVRATYPIAVLATGNRKRLAEAFVARVLAPEGQHRLHAAGFRPILANKR